MKTRERIREELKQYVNTDAMDIYTSENLVDYIYATQLQQELPNVKDIVKKFIGSDEPDTFIRNEYGVLMYYSHDKQSGINLESYFEDLVQYIFDEIDASSANN